MRQNLSAAALAVLGTTLLVVLELMPGNWPRRGNQMPSAQYVADLNAFFQFAGAANALARRGPRVPRIEWL